MVLEETDTSGSRPRVAVWRSGRGWAALIGWRRAPREADEGPGDRAGSRAGAGRPWSRRRRVLVQALFAGAIAARARARPIVRTVGPIGALGWARTGSILGRSADVAARARRVRRGIGRPRGFHQWRRPIRPWPLGRASVSAERPRAVGPDAAGREGLRDPPLAPARAVVAGGLGDDRAADEVVPALDRDGGPAATDRDRDGDPRPALGARLGLGGLDAPAAVDGARTRLRRRLGPGPGGRAALLDRDLRALVVARARRRDEGGVHDRAAPRQAARGRDRAGAAPPTAPRAHRPRSAPRGGPAGWRRRAPHRQDPARPRRIHDRRSRTRGSACSSHRPCSDRSTRLRTSSTRSKPRRAALPRGLSPRARTRTGRTLSTSALAARVSRGPPGAETAAHRSSSASPAPGFAGTPPTAYSMGRWR